MADPGALTAGSSAATGEAASVEAPSQMGDAELFVSLYAHMGAIS
ncbi:hypothetical protein GCM10010388_72500 [Streptomyces mauvecolor]